MSKILKVGDIFKLNTDNPYTVKWSTTWRDIELRLLSIQSIHEMKAEIISKPANCPVTHNIGHIEKFQFTNILDVKHFILKKYKRSHLPVWF